MKKKTVHIIAGLFLWLFMSSFYMGATLIPEEYPALLQEKNDGVISLGYLPVSYLQLSGAYSPVNGLGLKANLSSSVTNVIFNVQFAPGYYKMLSDKMIIEAYGGVGYGHDYFVKSVSTSDGASSWDTHYRGKYVSAYVSFDFGMVNLKRAHSEFAVGLKLLYQYYFDMYSEFGEGYRQYANNGNTVLYNFSKVSLVPYFTYRFGWEHLRFGLHLSGCALGQIAFPKFPVNFMISLNYYF